MDPMLAPWTLLWGKITDVVWPPMHIGLDIFLTHHYIKCHTEMKKMIHMHRMMRFVFNYICDAWLRTRIIYTGSIPLVYACSFRGRFHVTALPYLCRDSPLRWHHNEGDSVSYHQPRDFFTQPFIQAKIKNIIKAPRPWPLCGEFTVDRWIPRTKGQ